MAGADIHGLRKRNDTDIEVLCGGLVAEKSVEQAVCCGFERRQAVAGLEPVLSSTRTSSSPEVSRLISVSAFSGSQPKIAGVIEIDFADDDVVIIGTITASRREPSNTIRRHDGL